MNNLLLPKVLILSRGVWNEKQGTSSTLTNFFEDYDASKLAQVYIETLEPDTKCCYQFFQISEIQLIHKLFRLGLKTGHAIDTRRADEEKVGKRIAEQEARAMRFVRRHRSLLFSFARELLWRFGGWKSKELIAFVKDFAPDVIWIDSSTLPFLNKVFCYILRIVNKPAAVFMQDDIYTYDSCPKTLGSRIYKWYLRIQVKKVVKQCDAMFVASPKMKKEYDKIFGINSIFVAKSSHYTSVLSTNKVVLHQPLRLVYMGQIIYGRLFTLIDIAQKLKDINGDAIKVQLDIYTNNSITGVFKEKLLSNDCVILHEPVLYQDVPKVIAAHDVVLFVESFDKRYCKVARLSFSTKICDYLSSGKCVFAVGPSDIAPIEYFKEEDAAIVADSRESIGDKIKELEDSIIVKRYAEKAIQCARKNHNREKMDSVIYGKLIELSRLGYKTKVQND